MDREAREIIKLDFEDDQIIEEIEDTLSADEDIPIRDWAPWAIDKLIGIIRKLAPEKPKPPEPPKYELKEFVFVNGKLFEGNVTFNRFKGIEWDSGRTASIYLDPSPPSDADVILVDMGFGRIRRCFRLETDPAGMVMAKGKEWHTEDCRNDFRSHIKVEQLTPSREDLMR